MQIVSRKILTVFLKFQKTMSEKTLILLAGPTAVGKTHTAIQLSKALKAPIISADSRQVYRELHIGVAKPSTQELLEAPHHLIGHVSIHQSYSVAEWLQDTQNIIQNTSSKYILITGGTGLYFKALIRGLDNLPQVDSALRQSLEEQLKHTGLQSLVQELLQLDPLASNLVAMDNPRRVLRALELVKQTNLPLSQLYGNRSSGMDVPMVSVGLNMDRTLLYNRINQRVDNMVEAGLEQEARLFMENRSLQALQTVGYTEWFDHFLGRTNREAAIGLIKRNTRRYAKRQLTWFRNQMTCTWFEPDQTDEILTLIQKD